MDTAYTKQLASKASEVPIESNTEAHTVPLQTVKADRVTPSVNRPIRASKETHERNRHRAKNNINDSWQGDNVQSKQTDPDVTSTKAAT